MEGTFALEQANIQNDRAPDVMMAFRWTLQKSIRRPGDDRRGFGNERRKGDSRYTQPIRHA